MMTKQYTLISMTLGALAITALIVPVPRATG